MSASRLSGKSCGSSVIFLSKPSSRSLVIPAEKVSVGFATERQVVHRPGIKPKLDVQHDRAMRHLL
jgi:hypothetical protein